MPNKENLMLSQRFGESEHWELETSQEAWLLSDYGLKNVVCEQLKLNIGQISIIGVVFQVSFGS